jgi:hypothetical protein
LIDAGRQSRYIDDFECRVDDSSRVIVFKKPETKNLQAVNVSFEWRFDPKMEENGPHTTFIKGTTMTDPMTFLEILGQTEFRPAVADNIDNQPLKRIDGVSAWGVSSFWLNHHLELKRFHFKKSANDLWGTRNIRLGQRLKSDMGPMLAVEEAVEVAESKTIGTYNLPTRFTVLQKHTLPTRAQEAWRYDVEIQELELEPPVSSVDFRVKTPIPEGFPVYAQSEPQIMYEWRDGRPQRVVSARVDAALTDRSFVTGRAAGIGTAALVAVLTCAAVMIFRRTRA